MMSPCLVPQSPTGPSYTRVLKDSCMPLEAEREGRSRNLPRGACWKAKDTTLARLSNPEVSGSRRPSAIVSLILPRSWEGSAHCCWSNSVWNLGNLMVSRFSFLSASKIIQSCGQSLERIKLRQTWSSICSYISLLIYIKEETRYL